MSINTLWHFSYKIMFCTNGLYSTLVCFVLNRVAHNNKITTKKKKETANHEREKRAVNGEKVSTKSMNITSQFCHVRKYTQTKQNHSVSKPGWSIMHNYLQIELETPIPSDYQKKIVLGFLHPTKYTGSPQDELSSKFLYTKQKQ